jgi:hypothetical protein
MLLLTSQQQALDASTEDQSKRMATPCSSSRPHCLREDQHAHNLQGGAYLGRQVRLEAWDVVLALDHDVVLDKAPQVLQAWHAAKQLQAQRSNNSTDSNSESTNPQAGRAYRELN